MSSEETGAEPSTAGGTAYEPLACVTCRSRKLKCDRVKPRCSRCVKVQGDCVYPESRRKPAFKRRNVRELEARLAQVEGMLKDAAGKPLTERASPLEADSEFLDFADFQEARSAEQDADFVVLGDTPDVEGTTSSQAQHQEFDFSTSMPQGGNKPPNAPFSWSNMPPTGPLPADGGNSASELLYLGLFEALPPYEMIEDLHRTYFQRQHHFIPIVHPARYLKAFYSAPHMRPPMALQYAIWTMAANGHEKYSSYHDAFHRRARQYLHEDELKGSGEFFLTIEHAQAWALIATDEARCMWFTRAAMSAARCIKLIHMMGLHRLDDEPGAGELTPTIVPPKDWTELEERRRIFWGAFCIDSHASITTGWPTLIDFREVSTHLPSSEEAFNNCREEKTSTLPEVFEGASYSAFAGTAIICHIFNQILKHVHRPQPTDQPDNPEFGPFWNRHRELDNTLSSTFMFLPERFRLPKNIRDPIAVATNLNLHASVICLHNAACEKAEEFNLRPDLKAASQVRLLASAQEIVSIVKVTSHMNTGYRSPLVSLSIYCATLVYISHLKSTENDPTSISNIEFLIKAMEAMGKQHFITRAFLQQVVLDIKENGLANRIRVNLPKATGELPPAPCGHNIPLFARSKVSKHTRPQPVLPGRLPLGNPIGRPYDTRPLGDGCPANLPHNLAEERLEDAVADDATGNNKRKRTKSPEATESTTIPPTPSHGFKQGIMGQTLPINGLRPLNPNGTEPFGGPMYYNAASAPKDNSASESFFIPTSMPSGQEAISASYARVLGHMKLPHRAGSDASSPSTSRTAGSTQAGSSSATPGISGGDTGASAETTTPGQNPPFTPLTAQAEFDLFQGLDWGDMSGSVFEPVGDLMRNTTGEGSGDNDPWGLSRPGSRPPWDTGGNG